MARDRNVAKRGGEIIAAVKERYRKVALNPTGHFRYPVGWESALGLGYASEWLDAIPPEVIERFVGVGNPFNVKLPKQGDRVLDVGCGCGMDTFIAALLVGPEGRAVGLDLTVEMLEWPRRAALRSGLTNLKFQEGSAEKLPFDDGSFDLVISNGVLNLTTDKDSAFREISRVLRPKGIFAAADLLIVETVPEEVLADMDAWSN